MDHMTDAAEKGGVILQIRDFMTEEQKRLQELTRELEDYIRNAPEGTFFASRNGKYFKWYTFQNGQKIPINKKNKALAYRLAMKTFAGFRLKETVKELKAIDAYLQESNETDSETFLREHEAIRQLITEHKPLSERVQKWANEDYPRNTEPYKGTLYKTMKGDLVKSIAERDIANALFLAGIPYRYECALSFDNGRTVIYPDFMIMDPQTGKIYLWEHFGMAELNYYQHKNANKLYVYFENGYVPGLNLITTASDDKTKLTPAKIRQTIHYYFSV